MLLEMESDRNAIEHLGIRMYSTLPPVIAELINGRTGNLEDQNLDNLI